MSGLRRAGVDDQRGIGPIFSGGIELLCAFHEVILVVRHFLLKNNLCAIVVFFLDLFFLLKYLPKINLPQQSQ